MRTIWRWQKCETPFTRRAYRIFFWQFRKLPLPNDLKSLIFNRSSRICTILCRISMIDYSEKIGMVIGIFKKISTFRGRFYLSTCERKLLKVAHLFRPGQMCTWYNNANQFTVLILSLCTIFSCSDACTSLFHLPRTCRT